MSFIFLRNRVTGGAAFTPASLFASGEEGAWYEPSTTTCFTDTAGTTAAGVGDAVARINDLSGNGNHATQATSSARPILARVPETGRRNLLERTEEFDDAYWTKVNASITANNDIDPNGDTTADLLVENTASSYHYVTEATTPTLATTTFSVYAKQGAGSRYLHLSQSFQESVFVGSRSITVDLSSGTITQSRTSSLTGGSPPALVEESVTSVGNGWYRVVFAVTNTLYATSHYNIICLSNSATPAVDGYGRASYTGDGTSGIYIWGAQLEAASSASAYQKVVDQYDITEAGVTSVDYLFDDEADDAISWTAPADTDYTIARVDTSGNVTILTGQSLSGATDILLEQDIAGYVAVDRALTSQETTDLTAYLEALA